MAEGVALAARVTERAFDAAVTLPAGEITALVGPNGAGKSTCLALVSGQLFPDAGTVTIDEAEVTRVPAHRRAVALLQQRPLLFPHLDVLANVAFGVRARGASRRAASDRALAELDAVGAAGFARRRAHQLSGGEAQRVALARALATDPTVVLLDEPFAALDVATAASLRGLLASRLRGGRAAVALVTHDPLDLWALADRVVVFEGGRAVAAGPCEDVLGRPPTPFVAELVGTNRLVGVASGDGTLDLGSGLAVTGVTDAAAPPVTGASGLALFEPAAVGLHRVAPGGSPRNAWPATVVGVEPRGALVRVRLELASGQRLAADVTPRAVVELGVAPGVGLVAAVKAAQVRLHA